MKPIFNPDSPIMVFLGRVADLMILSVLWIITSIPIITIGASTTALYYTLFKFKRNEGGLTVATFLKSFRRDFKQSTCAVLCIIAFTIFFVADFIFIKSNVENGYSVFSFMLSVIGVLFAMTVSYVFPYIATFQNSLREVFVNCVRLVLQNFWTSVLATLVNLFPIVVLVLYTPVFLKFASLLLLIGIGAIGNVNATLIYKVFQQYIPDLETEKDC